MAVEIVDFVLQHWLLAVLALAGLAFWMTSRRLLVRRLVVYSVAVVVFGGYQLLKLRCRWFPVSESVENARWDYLHDLFSRLVLRVIQRLEGFWVKVGQYLSARGDVMPEVWVQRLSSLQDELPPRPFSTIERQVVGELGQPMAELFSAFDPTPMATASIAQVHKAMLRDSNRLVVVKVQHEGVDALMRQDMVNLERIISWVAYFEPEFDFKPVVAEYTKAAVHELDFVEEAHNLRRVAGNLLAAGIDVLVPLPIDHLVRRSVMVMEFMEGFKITQVEEFERYGIDRAAVVRRVCEAFAHQVFVAGFFNADPHPGNILINVDPHTRRVRPVLLDYGLVKALDDKYRLAFAALVASANSMDFGGLLRSFDMMGLVLKRTDPLEDMRHIRFILRDTKPASEMRAEFSTFRSEQLSKLEKLPRNKRNPVEAWPADLLFFFRVLFLLRGLCARLNVRIKYLPVLAPYARWAIIQQFPSPQQHALTPLPPAALNTTILEVRIRNLLKTLYAENLFVGIQVAAYYEG